MCDNYVIDIHAAFGVCKCGRPRSDHAAGSVSESGKISKERTQLWQGGGNVQTAVPLNNNASKRKEDNKSIISSSSQSNQSNHRSDNISSTINNNNNNNNNNSETKISFADLHLHLHDLQTESNQELDDSIFRWPSEDRNDTDNEEEEKEDNNHEVKWIGNDFHDFEDDDYLDTDEESDDGKKNIHKEEDKNKYKDINSTYQIEDYKVEDSDDENNIDNIQKPYIEKTPHFIHLENNTMKIFNNLHSEKRMCELYSNRIESKSVFNNNLIIDTIELTDIGSIVHNKKQVILYLPDPKYRGIDHRPYGHWDLKYIISCSSEQSAWSFKNKIYNATLHLQYYGCSILNHKTDNQNDKNNKLLYDEKGYHIQKENSLFSSLDLNKDIKKHTQIYKLYSDKLIIFSELNGIIIEKIPLCDVGLVVQRKNYVILYLPNPKSKGIDHRPLGNWDIKYIISCSSERSARIFKERIYNATLHLHYKT